MTRDGAPFPAEGVEADWDFTRAREPADVNPDVRRAVDADGYCLFRIGARFSDIAG